MPIFKYYNNKLFIISINRRYRLLGDFMNKNKKWSTHDIMITAMLSIALGVLYIPLTYFAGWSTNFPFLDIYLTGTYYFPIVMVGYLIRKKGSALFAAVIIFLIQIPFTPYGVLMLYFALLLGLPIEIMFIIKKYNNLKLWYIMLIGGIVGILGSINRYFVIGLGVVSIPLLIYYFTISFVCGSIWGGALAKFLSDKILKTGVLHKNGRKNDFLYCMVL